MRPQIVSVLSGNLTMPGRLSIMGKSGKEKDQLSFACLDK